MEKRKSKITSVDDIQRKNEVAKREQMRVDIAEDINGVISQITLTKKNTGKRKSPLYYIGLFLLFLLLGIVALNFILANIWLLKFFIQDFSKYFK